MKAILINIIFVHRNLLYRSIWVYFIAPSFNFTFFEQSALFIQKKNGPIRAYVINYRC